MNKFLLALFCTLALLSVTQAFAANEQDSPELAAQRRLNQQLRLRQDFENGGFPGGNNARQDRGQPQIQAIEERAQGNRQHFQGGPSFGDRHERRDR